MDDFLNNILSSSSWPDNENGASRSSWVGSTSAQTNGLLTNPIGVYEGDEKTTSSPLNIIPSGPIIGHMAHEDPPVFVGGNSNYSLNKMLFPNKAQPQDLDHVSALPPQLDNGSQKGNLLLQGMIQTSPNSQSSALLPQRSSQLLSTVGVSVPPLWSASYSGVSSLPPALAQGNLQGFGLQGEFVESGADILGKRYIGDDKLPQLDNLPVSSLNEQNELHNPHYRPFTAVPPLTSPKTTGLQPHQQLSQSSEANSIQHYPNQSSVSQPVLAASGSCNGTAKPRVRARRGQATDPHSIAERLRREKIAERMKNLQELVPNSNKTDKASMLDEIIDYVKFLQLQVKVLSMSRLGAAGAVVPLITDVQSEGSGGLLLSASIGQGPDLSESPENIAFEQEVVKLMESNVTTAMQYLQTKGLCLMPIALAAAISSGKASSNTERMNLSTSQGPISPNSGPACSGTSNKSITKDNATTINCCNGSVVKQEEVQKSASIKESTPKA